MKPGTKLITPLSLISREPLPTTGVPNLDEIIGGNGYPDKSAILVTGPPGIGKEALGYWFAQAGVNQGDFCLYLTRLTIREVLQDEKAFGITTAQESMIWFAREGGQVRLDLRNLPGLMDKIKDALRKNADRKMRIVTDVLSSVLMLNSQEATYRFVDELIAEVKERDAVLLATLEEGMHPFQTQTAMQQLFDGVVELSFQKTALDILPLLRVVKMRGVAPSTHYYAFSFARSGMNLAPARLTSHPPEGSPSAGIFTSGETGIVFDYLVKSFLDDYMTDKVAIEGAGWRTRVAIADATGVKRDSFYGEGGRFGPVLKELLSSGLVETRFFPGERGRGGEVVKLRVAYEKELVKRLVERAGRSAGVGA